MVFHSHGRPGATGLLIQSAIIGQDSLDPAA
jgi:hypothetical protein